MNNIIVFFLSYLLVIISVLGYGLVFEKILYNKEIGKNVGYTGLIGIFFLVIYSYFSHFFLAHDYLHNSIILFIDFIFFCKFFSNLIKKINIFLIIIFVLLFVGLLIFKTHDDFPYYHFPYSYYLTQNKMILGTGQFNHGFKTPSSIFYLNSLFYLPGIKYYTFYFSTVLLMGFSNLTLMVKIVQKIRKKNFDYIFYFSLLTIVFINIFFYRIQEHGTDRSAQILIFILFIELLVFVKLNEKDIININNIFLLIGLVISLKSFYILYSLILIPILIILYNEKKLFLVQTFLKNKFFLSFLFLLILMVSVNFFNSGCLIYPVSLTCFDLSWSLGAAEAEKMNTWYQQWSKGGANPNFRVENPELYIKKFNWVSNWIDIYFFNKVLDFILGIFVLVLVFIFIFYKKKKSKLKIASYELIIYTSFFLLLFEWFYNHPALRYGGYCLIAIFLFYPISLLLQRFTYKANENKNKLIVLMLITLTIFLSRNLIRINDEKEQYNYRPLKNVYYRIDQNHFRIQNLFNKLLDNYKNCEKNTSECPKIEGFEVKKTLTNNYLFTRNND